MLKKDLKLRFNQVVIEYTFEDVGMNIIRTTMPGKGQEPTIVGRSIYAIGPDVNKGDGNDIEVGHNVILGRNAEYNTIPIFFEDNELDRAKISKEVTKAMVIDANKVRFKRFQVKAYTLITDGDIVASFTGKVSEQVDYEEANPNTGKPIIPLIN